MRQASALIWDTWNQGQPLVGDRRACTRVTIEPGWSIKADMSPGRGVAIEYSGASRWPPHRNPVHWWQRQDNSQVEKEIPQENILTVTIDRSIDTDAAQLNLEMLNTLPEYNSPGPARRSPTVFQQPGALTFNFGDHPEAKARWGHHINDWHRLLMPGGFLRTYQGYGGHTKTIDDAVEDGNLLLTGQWIIDDVTPNSAGQLTVVARDTFALLVDQLARPPLVPKACYPTRFFRWVWDTRKIVPQKPIPSGASTVGKRIKYHDSSADRWYGGAGSNAAIHGHRGTDSVDGNPGTFALSVGNSHPSRPFCTDFFEYTVGEQINALTVRPWGGNYDTYISVKENGRWVGNNAVPYDHAPLIGNQPTVVDTGADIPYVMKGGIGWEQEQRFQLPRMFKAELVRVTFRNHTKSPWGPWFYRCGIREIRAEIHSPAGSIVTPAPIWVDLAAVGTGDGYFALSDRGKIETFGSAQLMGEPAGAPLAATKTAAQSIALTEDESGYYVLAGNGKVWAYGDAVHRGDASDQLVGDAVRICLTYTGLGYWIVTRSGAMYAYGDAPEYSPVSGWIASAASHPTDYGLWLIRETGTVHTRGAAVNYGNAAQTTPGLVLSGIVGTPTGLGYYTVEEYGQILAFGDAVHLGATSGFLPPPYPPGNSPAPKEPRINAIALAPIAGGEVNGYGTLAYDGRIFGQKDWQNFGQPSGGEVTVKKPGNYTDYSDIVRTFLLWAGFHWWSHIPNSRERPPLYGDIETTGAWAEETLKEDFFHNKPIIDIINTLKEVVGYIFYADDEGAAKFCSPNWWSTGNFWSDGPNKGKHTDTIPVIDERVNMSQYTAGTTKRHNRSEIMVGSNDPLLKLEGTRSYTHIPAASNTYLNGMMVPASLGVPFSVPLAEMKIMAELIGLHIWFARRTGQVTCLANPAISIDDQVRILERATSEVFIHYVRGVQSSHDLRTGVYTMTLTTHWLGSNDNSWAIHVDDKGTVAYPDARYVPEDPDGIERYDLSPQAYQRVSGARGASTVPTSDAQHPEAALAQVNDSDVPEGDDGAAT